MLCCICLQATRCPLQLHAWTFVLHQGAWVASMAAV